MRLQADQRYYKNAFKKHFHAYSNWQATGSDPSKRLILVYCVECGLKYEVMKKERLVKITDVHLVVKTTRETRGLNKP